MARVVFSVLLMAAMYCAAVPALAEDGEGYDDHDAAQEVYEGAKSGKFLTLAQIIARADFLAGLEIIEAKFEKRGAVPAYEIYYLDKSGRRREVYLDARTGKILNQSEEAD